MTERTLAAATSVGAMGELVQVTPGAGDPYTLYGIFDADHEVTFPNTDTAVTSSAPVLSAQESALPAPIVAGDRLDVRGKLYGVVDVQPDGQGTVDLILNEVDA